MNEFFNWNDSLILWQYHWIWFLAAFFIGLVIGYRFNTWKIS